MGIALTSEWVEKHNQRVANGRTPPVESPRAVAVATRLLVKKSTDEQKLNKLETRYLQYLRSLGHQWIGVQNWTLKIADDCRYTCDFFILDENGQLEGHETKGPFCHEDSWIKIKVAARSFQMIRFKMVRWVNNQWEITDVKP